MAAKCSCLRSDIAAALLILTGRSLRSYAAPRLQLLLSISYDFLASLQPRPDHHRAALGQGDLHRTHLSGIVGVNNVSKRAVGSAQNGAGWRRDRILHRL